MILFKKFKKYRSCCFGLLKTFFLSSTYIQYLSILHSDRSVWPQKRYIVNIAFYYVTFDSNNVFTSCRHYHCQVISQIYEYRRPEFL